MNSKRTIIILLLLAFTFRIYSQSYVNAGIQHYNRGELEEARSDFNEAEKMKEVFTPSAIGKLYFYKALTEFKMFEIKDLGIDDIRNILGDFNQAIAMDSALWFQEAENVLGLLSLEVENRAGDLLKDARKILDREDRVAKTHEYSELLNLVEQLDKEAKIDLLRANAYHEIGDLYFNSALDVAAMQEAGKHYSQAIEYYELA